MDRHPNTLRRYETWGFMSPVDRLPNGYRRPGRPHYGQAFFATTALAACFQVWEGRRLLKGAIDSFARGNWPEVEQSLDVYKLLLHSSLDGAQAAHSALAAWRSQDKRLPSTKEVKGSATPRGTTPEGRVYSPSQAAQLLGVASDTLRDWQRNGLVDCVRNRRGYRRYRPADIDQARVVHSLLKAGYRYLGLLALLRGASPLADLGFARDRWADTLGVLLGDVDSLYACLAWARADWP